MNILRLLPVVLSALLLGAHFLRAGMVPLMVLALLFPALLFFKRYWATRVVQVILVLGALEWIRTLMILVDERSTAGQPWVRAAMIIGLVALFTGGSALLFSFSDSFRKRYGLVKSLKEEGDT